MNGIVGANRSSALDAFREELAADHLQPLWDIMRRLAANEPANGGIPIHWSWSDLRSHVMRAGELVTAQEAERRVLVLENPAFPGEGRITSSLYSGVQLIMPGETAPSHRHTASALRLILEGEGAFTTVAGERILMSPGDFIVTPSGSFHDHGNDTDKPVMWLDGLDFPLVNSLDVGFFELHSDTAQQATVPDDLSSRQFIHGRLNPAWVTTRTASSPIGNYPWTETARAFESIADSAAGSAADGVLLEYTNPWTGGPVLPTMACRIQRLVPGFSGVPRRHTAGTILHVVRGSGTTVVNGTSFDWAEHDILAIPSWATYEHRNGSRTEDAVLFSYTNEPVVRAVGMYREQLL